MNIRALAAAVLTLALAGHAIAQAPQFSNGVRPYVKYGEPVIILTNARVIDGTGAPARENQSILIRDGNVAAMGDAASTKAPEGAAVIDLAGKTVIPGLVMFHEHL